MGRRGAGGARRRGAAIGRGSAAIACGFAAIARGSAAIARGSAAIARGSAAIGLAVALAASCSRVGTGARPTPVPQDVAALADAAPGLDPQVLALALTAVRCAARCGLVASPGIVTVIDYSRPSNEPRLWVLDVTRRRLLHRELVAHGRGSGELYATRFSNDPGSKQSSLGLFATAEVYDGQHGRSLRLYGLEPGINDNALARALVIHGADYVSPDFAAAQGRLGRSHGCPALPLAVAQAVIDTIHGGTPLFAYYPDAAWLETSRFLGTCVESTGTRAPD